MATEKGTPGRPKKILLRRGFASAGAMERALRAILEADGLLETVEVSHDSQEWGRMVVLAFGYAAFVHVSSKAGGFPDEKYRSVLDLVEDPMAPLGLEVKLPDKAECSLNSVSRVGHRIEGALAKKGQRLASGFSFLWRVSLLLGATDDATESGAPEQEQQQALASTLTEAAAEANLMDEFCKELIHDIAFSASDSARKATLKDSFESWAFQRS